MSEGIPSGTLTCLFTDIEQSTERWERDPVGMAEALAVHDEILAAAVMGHDGEVFKHTGDGVCAVFASAPNAARAAVAAHQALRLPVRMALHTGVAQRRASDYFGPVLNRAARILAAGHGGQVLASDVTERLLDDVDAHDLGVYEFKGLADTERVWQLGSGVFAPLRARRRGTGRLPSASRSFVGRGDESAQLASEVRPGRAVTVVGAGGVGKTRLVLEVAHALAGDFADGVWWCELAPIENPDTLVAAVASSLAVVFQPAISPTAAVVDALQGRRALVVFDNCEHLLDAAAALIGAILEECSTVAVVATSREPLGIGVEQVWPLRPLDPESDGVELFLQRARAADATFTVGSDRPVVIELCRHLDGLPLAIELAAARVRTLTPTELLGRLHDRFRSLRGGRDGPDRHRTLLATLDWSYNLLTRQEQLLLDRLTVFSGSFAVEAVSAI